MITRVYSKSSNSSGFNPILQKFYEMICEIIISKTVCGIFLFFCQSRFINNFMEKNNIEEQFWCLKKWPCYDVLIILSSQQVLDTCLMYKKSRTRLIINLSSNVGSSKQLRQGVPCKAKNCHAFLSHEQYFSKHRFLDIGRCAFKCK